MKRILVVLFAGLLVFSIFTCENTPTEGEGDGNGNGSSDLTADQLVDSANTAMGTFMSAMLSNPPDNPEDAIGGDYSGLIAINELFRQAVEEDPEHAMANFGAGLTELLLLVSDGTEFMTLIQEWQTFLATTNLFGDSIETGTGKVLATQPSLFSTNPFAFESTANISSTSYLKAITTLPKFAQETPELSDWQDLIESTIMARVDYAITRLAVVEEDDDFVFTITPEMQGDAEATPRELDLTEVYMFDAVLHSIRSWCNVIVSYNVNISPYDTTAFDRLEPEGSFMTLRDGYESNMPAALDDIHSILDKAEAGLGFLLGEQDSQSDDIIIIGPFNGEQPGIPLDTLLIAQGYIDSIRTVFSEPVSYDLKMSETINSEGDLGDGFITIDISKVFDPAIDNLKSFLPAYSIAVGKDTSYESLGDEMQVDTTFVDAAEATIESAAGTSYNFSYFANWEADGDTFSVKNGNIEIPEFEAVVWDTLYSLVENIELPENQRISWINVSIVWGSFFQSAGSKDILADIQVSYGIDEATFVDYYPIPIWDDTEYGDWITGFDATLFDILPDFTQADWEWIFSQVGITSETYSPYMFLAF